MSATAEIEKPRFARAAAIEVAREICAALGPVSERLIVAGSLRRKKPDVGDVEILYIPRRGMHRPAGEIFERPANLADVAIDALLAAGILAKRESRVGTFAWGDKNKLARHVASGIPVDLFTATEANWHNYLVCRTGPAGSNTRIAVEAQARGWKWNPYGAGFTRGGALAGEPESYAVTCEEDVFRFVGLPFLPSEERCEIELFQPQTQTH